MNGWIGVDLDGTLAHYDQWRGIHHIGEPIPAMVDRVKRWLDDGHDVRIFTARVSDEEAIVPITNAIRNWCLKHIGVELVITNVKDFGMHELWDDRAVQVEANTGKLIGHSRRGLT